MKRRWIIQVHGIVQGVGFRPFVYREATALGLHGSVANRSGDVTIDAEGPVAALKALVECIRTSPPPHARVKRIDYRDASPAGAEGFRIDTSSTQGSRSPVIPPDLALCAECREELLSRDNRRFHHPFITCVNCGPRYTIIERLPYDRETTTMSGFPLCPDCRREYHDPTNRRFHAQPVACLSCGPTLFLIDPRGKRHPTVEPVVEAAELLTHGSFVAIKGIGGYHLACDATNDAAVSSLRAFKNREHKPCAVMMPDISTVEKWCHLSVKERELLCSPAAPIVLLQRKPECRLSRLVAPGTRTIGVMLPYTPLHTLLLDATGIPLVMTSANRSSEPILYRDDEALRQLSKRQIRVLGHDRPIATGCDDSVTRIHHDAPSIIRRSRGYVPEPVTLPGASPCPILATGGQLKNTICAITGNDAYLSQHIGDLHNPRSLDRWRETCRKLLHLLGITPEIVACDLHPEYLSTQHAAEFLPSGSPGNRVVQVQHHHAHVVSCLAENGVRLAPGERVIGVAWDGTGFGPGGGVWGGEFLLADYAAFTRAAHFREVPLPGGEMAVREPWRLAVAYLEHCLSLSTRHRARIYRRWDRKEVDLVRQMLDRKINAPSTTSAGRLFDAVAALCGIRARITYEGQAAIELEEAAMGTMSNPYKFMFEKRGAVWVVDWEEMLNMLLEDISQGEEIPVISDRFHAGMATVIVEVCEKLRDAHAINRVALSGGVFQNMTLLNTACTLLKDSCFEVLTQRKVPCNDGGISLGQAVVAANYSLSEKHLSPQRTQRAQRI